MASGVKGMPEKGKDEGGRRKDESTTTGLERFSPRRRAFILPPSSLLVEPADGLAGEIDPDALDLRVEVEGVAAHLAAVAGLLEAAEGRGGVEHIEGVDPDDAGLDLLGEAVGAR